VPYMLAETVGQFNYSNRRYFTAKYRRAGDVTMQVQQALRHAQAHDRAAGYPRMAGVIAWCAFDYASLMNAEAGVKCPGVADVFRIPKPGAAFYRTQGDPRQRAVIEPGFYWDFGPQTPNGPGEHAPIFSNCDRLELFLDGRLHATVEPDRSGFPHTKHPPFFADLKLDHPAELRIDGYLGSRKVLSRSFSADTSADRLWMHADDSLLAADGIDATRVAFGIVDKFGAFRLGGVGEVHLTIEGPGELIGDNPFVLAESGGVGALWLRTLPGRAGLIGISATHALGKATVEVRAR
jgi:beta-galactosidase